MPRLYGFVVQLLAVDLLLPGSAEFLSRLALAGVDANVPITQV
ncbi:MAG TPA: hypothetical protein PKK23_19955 [Nitrospirales bacterium]|nr:hypothetical protein [Nitrospirales bacterium]